MKRILFSLIAFLAIGSNIQAQSTIDVIRVQDVEITPGGEAYINIDYDATNEPPKHVKGLQIELKIPAGFSLKSELLDEWDDEETIIIENVQHSAFTVAPRAIDSQTIRFAMASYSNTKAYFKTGTLFSVILVADPDVVSNVYQATVKGYGNTSNIQMSGASDQGDVTYYQAPINFRIKMPIELSEEKSYAEGFGNYTDVTVSMNKRILKANTWNTICLPFAMDAETIAEAFGEDNEVTLATLSGSETVRKDGVIKDIIIKFDTSSATEISANTPYLIKLKDAVETFAVDGVSLSDNIVPSSVSGGDATFIGNYDVITNLGEDTPALFISGNKFFYATGNSKLKSFRGYFTHTDLQEYIDAQSAGANISLFVDGEPTGIRNIVTTQDNNDIYDISGRKVNSDKTPLQKGIYIINGKKETVH